MKSLKQQVCAILNNKIKAIAVREYEKANGGKKRYIPYTLPACVDVMVSMLGRIEASTPDELEGFASYATTGEVFELSNKV